MIVDAALKTTSMIVKLLQCAGDLLLEVSSHKGMYSIPSTGLQITTHYPLGNDMMITNNHKKKKALFIGGKVSKFSQLRTNEICGLLRDELHWPSVLVNCQTPNKPSIPLIQKSLEWLTEGITNQDTIFLYYCGACSLDTDCTITINEDTLELLTTLRLLLGSNQPNVLIIMDTNQVSLNSLPFQHSRQAPTRCEPTANNAMVCLTNHPKNKMGQLTQQLVQLMHNRHLRLTVEQILSEGMDVIVKSNQAKTALDRIFIGVE